MSIDRQRPGVYIELMAKASERVLPKSGRVLIPYIAEWGAPDTIVEVVGYDERIAETFGLVDTVELAAEGGAAIVLYRMTNGNAQTAKYTQAGSVEISARYPGTLGNSLTVSIAASLAEVGKKELVVNGPAGAEKYSFADADELVGKLVESQYIRASKLGTTDIADVAETPLSGGVSGNSLLAGNDFTALFSAIDGADFDTLYLPTDDVAIQAAAKQFMKDRRSLNQKLSTLVIGGTSATDNSMDAHVTRSIAMNERYVVNSAIAGEHINGKTYTSLQWGAWTAGMLAATPAHISLTAQPVPLKKAVKDWSHTEIRKGLSNGVFLATRDGSSYVVESAVNTLTTLHAGEREDFGKIRVSMTLDQVMNDLIAVGKKYKGKLSNNSMGRATFIAAAGSYLDERVRQGALGAGAALTEHPDKTSSGDTAHFSLQAQPLDAIEIFSIAWEVL